MGNFRQWKKAKMSLLPICGKVFESLIYNSLFEFFIENELISSNQSGFKPSDCCINQLLSITHEIFKSFCNRYEVIILLFIFIMDSFIKLKENRVNGNLLNLIINFLEARKKRVVLKDQFLGLFSLYLLMTFLTT